MNFFGSAGTTPPSLHLLPHKPSHSPPRTQIRCGPGFPFALARRGSRGGDLCDLASSQALWTGVRDLFSWAHSRMERGACLLLRVVPNAHHGLVHLEDAPERLWCGEGATRVLRRTGTASSDPTIQLVSMAGQLWQWALMHHPNTTAHRRWQRGALLISYLQQQGKWLPELVHQQSRHLAESPQEIENGSEEQLDVIKLGLNVPAEEVE